MRSSPNSPSSRLNIVARQRNPSRERPRHRCRTEETDLDEAYTLARADVKAAEGHVLLDAISAFRVKGRQVRLCDEADALTALFVGNPLGPTPNQAKKGADMAIISADGYDEEGNNNTEEKDEVEKEIAHYERQQRVEDAWWKAEQRAEFETYLHKINERMATRVTQQARFLRLRLKRKKRLREGKRKV
ncbi:MAG: hypothetical protein Q9164_006824 [Protoblastenia rupestris]